MRVNQRTLVDSSRFNTTYAGAAKKDTIELPLDFAMQRAILDIEGTMDITVGNSVLVDDAGLALLSGIQLQLTGKGGVQTLYNLDGVDTYIKNFFDYKNALKLVTPTAIANGVSVGLVLVIDFRTNKSNEEDFGSVIPLYMYSSANLVITWVVAATGYGTNTGNWSLTGKVTLIELVPQTAQDIKDIATNTRLLKIYTKPVSLDAAVTEQLRDRDIDVGNLIRSVYIVARASGGTARSDAQIGYVTLGTASENFIEEMDWVPMQILNKMEYTLPIFDGDNTMKGVAVLNFAKFPVDPQGNPLGLNTVGLKQGDLKLKLDVLVASPDIRYIHEIYYTPGS